MLTIKTPATEMFYEKTQEFYSIPEASIKLEHSLHSVDLWESKHKKSFLSFNDKTEEDFRDYIRCMTLNRDEVNPLAFLLINEEQIKEIEAYMNDSMTATKFNKKRKPSSQFITSEMIFSWMAAAHIPFECQYWHLNKLLTLIEACAETNNPDKKKIPKADVASRYRELNRARRLKHGSRG